MRKRFLISVLLTASLALGTMTSSMASQVSLQGEYTLEANNTSTQGTENTESTEDTEKSTEPTEKPEVKNGLVKEGKDLYYYKDGELFTDGLKVIKEDGKKCYYYFGEDGKAIRNKFTKVKLSEKSYYYFFQKDGKAKTKSWMTIDDKTYYFGSNGRAYTGIHNISHYYCRFTKKAELVRKVDKDKKLVAITYDDGPSIHTPSVLDTLEEYDAVATFFVVGNRVSTYKDYVKRAYKMGCEIGNHTYQHKILTKVSKKEIKNQISKTNKAVKKITGANPIVMRPPGGARNTTVNNNVGMPQIIWSVDPTDWKNRNKETVEKKVLDNVSDGDIVLMHDLYESTANAAPKIFSTLKKRGFEFVTVSELAAIRGVKLKKGVSYFSFKKKKK